MITRIWHGWTSPDRAGAYEALLREEIFPAIHARAIPGLAGLSLLRRAAEAGGEVEFVTLMRFADAEAIRRFAGAGDPEAAVVPPDARALLARFDARAMHYDTLV
jgi:antibiotic biosynthesis monooxygenase (ABM) superfamily enzyme